MDITVLEDIGLSKSEVKVFVTILELGESKAGKIIEASNLQSSSVYNSINSLINKGFVSYIKKGQGKISWNYKLSCKKENSTFTIWKEGNVCCNL